MQSWIPYLALVAGAFLCFAGFRVMRFLLGLVGAWAGWLIGFWLGSMVQVDPVWNAVALWGGAIFGAVVAGTLAYTFYAGAVLVAVGNLGWQLGTGAALWLGLVGPVATATTAAVAIAAVVVGFLSGLPRLLLIIPTALVGASGIVGGVLDLINQIDLTALTWWNAADLTTHGLVWNLAFLVLAGFGALTQLKLSPAASLRASYGHGR